MRLFRVGVGATGVALFVCAASCVGDTAQNADGADAGTDAFPDAAMTATDAPAATDAGSDAPTDAPVDAAATCDPTTPFGTPAIIAGLAGATQPRLSQDELTIYFSAAAGIFGDAGTGTDLYTASRAKRSDAFGTPTPLGVNTSANEKNPSVSSDGLRLFYDSDASGTQRLWFASRTSTLADFETASAIGTPPASPAALDVEGWPFISADDAELWFASARGGGLGGTDIYVAQKIGSSFGNAMLQPTLSSSATDWKLSLSHDRLTIYFASLRTGVGTSGLHDIWTARRTSTLDPFPSPTPSAELNSAGNDYPGWLSPDNCRIYFASDRSTADAVYMAERKL